MRWVTPVHEKAALFVVTALQTDSVSAGRPKVAEPSARGDRLLGAAMVQPRAGQGGILGRGSEGSCLCLKIGLLYMQGGP